MYFFRHIIKILCLKRVSGEETKKVNSKLYINVLGAEEFDVYMKEQDEQVAEAMDLIGMKKQ